MDSMPSKRELMSAISEVMKSNPILKTFEMNDLVANHLHISDDLLEIEDSNCSGTEFGYRMRWARTELRQTGILCNVRRGEWRLVSSITDNVHPK